MNDRHDQAGSAGGLTALQGALFGILLFGDYLALTLSRLFTGATGNWLLLVAALQPVLILMALLLGQFRRNLPLGLGLGMLCLCTVGLGHAADTWALGNDLAEYSGQKFGALFLLLVPALVCGAIAGQAGGGTRVPGAALMPWTMGLLVALCLVALATNPRLLTIEYYADPPVFFGFLVMPAHQPLAMCLAKGALLAFAGDTLRSHSKWRRPLQLAFVGAMLGLVLLTGARSYVLAMIVALAAMSLWNGRRLGLLLMGAAVAVPLFQSYASDLVQDRFDPSQVLESLAYQERELAWQTAWRTFLDNPLVGVGAGNFAGAGGWHGRVYPHNLVLEIGAEFGAVGLLGLLLLLDAALRPAILALWRRQPVDDRAMFAIGLLVFTFGGALAVGDLIRNYAVFFALGMTASAFRRAPDTRSVPVAAGRPVADPPLLGVPG